MRVLWITNIPVGDAGVLFTGKKSNGLWMDAELEAFIADATSDVQLLIATSARIDQMQKKESRGVTYYLLPDRISYEYRSEKKKNREQIAKMLEDAKPDLIHIWGTEMEISRDVIACNAGRAPCVVYIQGVVNSIPRYFRAGMTNTEICSTYTLHDILSRSGIYAQERRYKRKAENEREVICAASNIIGENRWSEAYYRAIDQKVRFFPCPLHINHIFTSTQWSQEKCIPHTVMCNSSNYSIKGLHMLLRALALVRIQHPDVKLIVPGGNPAHQRGFTAMLKRSGYIRYIRHLLNRYRLWDMVEFLPYITPDQMAKKMAQANVFVVPSSIENHSSSLKEAMLVGVPCVSSNVGGVSEYAVQGKNALLYRFEDYEVLADNICKLFRDPALAATLSANARADMMALHVEYDIHARMTEIYHQIVTQEGNKK